MGQGRKEVSRWLQAKLVGLGGAGGSVGPEKTERAVIATTDPETLPDEQSYKHVKHMLGWSQYQVRSDQAIRRHWQLVCCAFSFCWYHASHSCSSTTEDAREASEPPTSPEPEVAVDGTAPGKKNQQSNSISSTSVLAGGAAGRARVVGALDHAAALLASVVRAAPTTSSSALT